MLIKKPSDIQPSEITPPQVYAKRREFLKGGAALALGLGSTMTSVNPLLASADPFATIPKGPFGTDEEQTPFEAITSYNNFYEFALDKSGPAELSKDFKTRPWTVKVSGECENPKTWDIDDLLGSFPLEERIYRLRCVEAWSMVIPWVGFPLASLIKAARPTSSAKYLEFETLHDPIQMPGQIKGVFGGVLDWPYREGLRIDEAVHPLTIMGAGLYGQVMPNQNGAPIRLVVPWKYGFKSIKSIVSIRFMEKQPVNSWNQQAPREYGFYANVNPEVHHPRWSQARERRVGEWLKRDTLPFNGYGEQVASLYANMDLARFY